VENEEKFITITEQLVSQETPSTDIPHCNAAIDWLARFVQIECGVRPGSIEVAGRRQLIVSTSMHGPWKVLLLCHFDTVWPLGTLQHRPFKRRGDSISGPGVFDMKLGLAFGILLMAKFGAAGAIALAVNTDEEIGSPTSRTLIEDCARRSQYVLCLEPSGPGGAIKIARKGVVHYSVITEGVSAHAGLEPEVGSNVITALAPQISDICDLQNFSAGTSVTPTMLHAGTAQNAVPDHAELTIDVRFASASEMQRVENGLREIVHGLGRNASLERSAWRPAMQQSSSQQLYEMLEEIAVQVGTTVHGLAVGGASDGSLAASIGRPTLDGLGAVGGGAHAVDEWVSLKQSLERYTLVEALVATLLNGNR
jgi:glutamate carboxypeptidase